MEARTTSLRPEVLSFALLMERELRANDHKRGWTKDDPRNLVLRIDDETNELRSVVLERFTRDVVKRSRIGRYARTEFGPERLIEEPFLSTNTSQIAEEAADVANMAMMVADVCGALALAPSSPSPREEERERCARSQHRAADECDVAIIEHRQIEQFIEAQKIVPEQLPAEIKVEHAGDTTLTTLWSQNRPIAHWIRQRTEFNCAILTYAAAIRAPETGSGRE